MLKFDEINLSSGPAARQVAAQPAGPLLILGASARAACSSARRAGMQPVAADLFADRDLQSICRCQQVDNSQRQWIAAARKLVPDRTAWLYTGAFENQPGLVERISERLELWGTPAEALRRARDPQAVAAALDAAGLPSLQVRSSPPPPSSPLPWLRKPRRGSAGSGIQVWSNGVASAETASGPTNGLPTRERETYFQQRAQGHVLSAVCLALPQSTWLLGVTSQVIGCQALGAGPFGYCGSLGPLRLPDRVSRQIAQIGATLATTARLRGLFGVDLIHNDDGNWVTEVNPRYTASVEVLERGTGIPFLAWHRWSCTRTSEHAAAPADRDDRYGPVCLAVRPRVHPTAAKLIVYAQQDLRAPQITASFDSDGFAQFADLPQPGQQILKGHPVCSVLARGPDRASCSATLLARLQSLCIHLQAPPIDREQLSSILLECPFPSG